MFMDCSLIQQYTIREDMPMAHAPDVHICEVAPRDGLQNLDAFVPTEAKCALIDAIVAARVGEIERAPSFRLRSCHNLPTRIP